MHRVPSFILRIGEKSKKGRLNGHAQPVDALDAA
jgi:hypothetical protein